MGEEQIKIKKKKRKKKITRKIKTFCLFKTVVKNFKCLCFQCTPHRKNNKNNINNNKNKKKKPKDLKLKKEKDNSNSSSKMDSKLLRVCVFLDNLAAALFVCRGRAATTATSSARERLFCIILVKAMKGRGVAF